MVMKVLSNMTAEERHALLVSVFDRLLLEMNAQDRRALMEHVVEHFLDGLSNEERVATVRELVPSLLAQLMQSGGMTVDDLLWAAMGSLGALEQSTTPGAEGKEQEGPTTAT
jgi:hypothetical protein